MNNEKCMKNVYNSNYNKKHYKDLKIRLKFNEVDKIINFCKDINISINKLFVQIIKYVIDNDLFDDIMHK